MVSDLESLSFIISLKFDAITKLKYCNQCTVSPRVIEKVNGNLLIISGIRNKGNSDISWMIFKGNVLYVKMALVHNK